MHAHFLFKDKNVNTQSNPKAILYKCLIYSGTQMKNDKSLIIGTQEAFVDLLN